MDHVLVRWETVAESAMGVLCSLQQEECVAKSTSGLLYKV